MVLALGLLIGLIIGGMLINWINTDLEEALMGELRISRDDSRHYFDLFYEANKELRTANELKTHYKESLMAYAQLEEAAAATSIVAAQAQMEKEYYTEALRAYSEIEEIARNLEESTLIHLDRRNQITLKKIELEKEYSALQETNRALDENCRTWESKYYETKENLDKAEDDLKKLTVKAPTLTKKQGKVLAPRKKVA